MRARSSAARRARGLDARVVRGGAIERENEASVTHHARAQEWRRAAAHDAARGSRARARAGAVRAARTWSGASSAGAGERGRGVDERRRGRRHARGAHGETLDVRGRARARTAAHARRRGDVDGVRQVCGAGAAGDPTGRGGGV